MPASAIRFDDANKRIPLPTETGNLIVELARDAAGTAPALLHPSRHRAALRRRQASTRGRSHRLGRHDGARRRRPHRLSRFSSCSPRRCIKHKLPHPPITLLFTVREESGLHGARELNPADLGGAVMCINVDGQLASDLIIGAVGQENWEAEIKGRASHAGVAPEKGISATLVGAHRPGRGAAAPAGSARS